jgi:transcriptional regulator with XRE-family HTH domain
MAIDDERRQELGQLVRRTRQARTPPMTSEQAAERAPMSPVTWGNIERGQRVKPFSYAAVERVLGWKAGSIERFLATGEEPAPNRVPFPGHAVIDASSLIDLALRLDRSDSVKVDLVWVIRSGAHPLDAILQLDRDDHHKVEVLSAYRELEAHVETGAKKGA